MVTAQISPFTAGKQGRQKAKERTAPAAPFFSLPLQGGLIIFLSGLLPGYLSFLIIFFRHRWYCSWLARNQINGSLDTFGFQALPGRHPYSAN
ncbi:hypothetical protein, partial [Yersinia intermedia]|uniref:hypothetical protein n=2 Tax=Yersinia intermedia TaxID=631 RepID=UPI001C8F2D2E